MIAVGAVLLAFFTIIDKSASQEPVQMIPSLDWARNVYFFKARRKELQ
jgi:hypothetical protein